MCSNPDSLKRLFNNTVFVNTACWVYYSLIFIINFSDGKYSFYYIPNQTVIPNLELQMGIPEPHPYEDTAGVTLANDLVDGLEHACGIIDDNLGDSGYFWDDAYSLSGVIDNKNT